MQLHNLKRTNKNKKKHTIGRGGKRGKTSGRGTKGQLARSGRKLRPELRDIIKKLPKRRGRGKNIFQSFRAQPIVVNIGLVDAAFEKGATISPATLIASGIIRGKKSVRAQVKILGAGELTKEFTWKGVTISLTAKAKIDKVGGTIS